MRWFFFVSCLFPSLGIAEPNCLLPFNEFLSKFEADRFFQEKNTIFPLKHSYIDLGAEPEPKTVDNPLEKTEVIARKNSIFPSSALQKEMAFVKTIKATSGARSVVQFRKPNTGHLLIYYFQNIKGCWKLVKFEDAST